MSTPEMVLLTLSDISFIVANPNLDCVSQLSRDSISRHINSNHCLTGRGENQFSNICPDRIVKNVLLLLSTYIFRGKHEFLIIRPDIESIEELLLNSNIFQFHREK